MNTRKIKLEKNIAKLEYEIEERNLDAYYSDSWEQLAQIRKSIEREEDELKALQKELENL